MSLFRHEVMEARRRRLWGEVRLSQPPSLAAWTAMLGITSVAIVAGLTFGVYLRKETVSGYLSPQAGIVQIPASRSGRVKQVFVREGDHVAAGAPLVVLSGETGSMATGAVLGAQLDEIDLQIAAARSRESAAEANLSSDAARLANQIRAGRSQLALLQTRLDDQNQYLAIAEDQQERFQRLADTGYSSRLQLNQAKQQVLSARGLVNDLRRQLYVQRAQNEDLEGQAAAAPNRRKDATAAARAELSQLQQKRLDLLAARSFVEVAPVAGTVSSLQAEPGQLPPQGMPLASLMPDGSALQAELLVPSRAIGFIKVGDEARLQIDAFPFQRFGFLEGRVTGVSRSVLEPGQFLAPVPIKEAVYRVRVDLARDFITAYGVRQPLRPGMSLNAVIVIERKRLWQQALDPIFAAGRRSR